MRLDVVTIFPHYLAPLSLSLVGKAISTGLVDLAIHDLRDYTHDRHRTVDASPYGGGPGMVMRPEPWGEALDAVGALDDRAPTLVIPTPSGQVFDQAEAERLSGLDRLVFACGRYEGIDARVAGHYRQAGWPVAELSIGDYVLAGGEAAVLVIAEAVVRLLPGVLGNPESVSDDSFAADPELVEGPVYTRPARWRGSSVPEVLLSGDHARIRAWRHEQAVARTQQMRQPGRR